ncbi:hypothetical protein DIPPA_05293 [Diplonema papillatum]|nr:hypothetical protein DIPPA_05293 [Diplonema papillatum]
MFTTKEYLRLVNTPGKLTVVGSHILVGYIDQTAEDYQGRGQLHIMVEIMRLSPPDCTVYAGSDLRLRGAATRQAVFEGEPDRAARVKEHWLA